MAAGVLQDTFSLVGRRLGTMAAIVALIEVPYQLGTLLLRTLAGIGPESAEQMMGVVGALATPLVNAALLVALARWTAGGEITVLEALRGGTRYWGRLVVTYIALGFIFVGALAVSCLPGGLVMLVMGWRTPYVLIPFGVPALLFMVRYIYADCAVVEEGIQPWLARRRSIDLTAGRRLGLIGLAALLYVPAAVLELSGDAIAQTLTGVDPKQASALVPALLSAGFGLASSLLYLLPTVAFYLRYKEASREGSHRE
jgi:hypothetical protein